jgi:large subunit ribosomal protein L7Ae
MAPPKRQGKKIKKSQKTPNPLFEKKPRSFRVGGHILPKRDLTRFVRWPKYILLQRQKRILMTRIKVPGLIAQFGRTLDRDKQKELFNILKKYSPEDAKTKKQRLTTQAAQKKDGKVA